MKRWRLPFPVGVTLALICLITLPSQSANASAEFQSSTIFRLFQRDNLTGKSESVAPVYEYLQADIGNGNPKGLSLHLYGWGRTDLAGSDFYEDQSDAELLYGYLEYAHPASNLNLRLGRQQIVAGIANDSIDGLSLFSDLGEHFSLSAYGGLPVAFSTIQNRSGDHIYGGRLSHHLRSLYNIGLSYQKIVNDSDRQDQQLGIDSSFGLPANITLSGRSSYNLESNGWGEHSYEILAPVADFSLRPFFEKYDYRDYFAAGNLTPNPFGILTQSREGVTSYGTDILWHKLSHWDVGAKVKRFTYQVDDNNAAYYAGILTWHGAELTQIGGELGKMQGDTAKTTYTLSRCFFYWDQPGGRKASFISGDLLYALYDEAIYGEKNSLFASLGVGQRFLKDRLELKLSGDYNSGPDFNSDLRGTLVMNYRFGL